MGDVSRALLNTARNTVPEWRPAEAQQHLADDKPITLVDVREQTEWNEGYIPNAVHVPRGFLELRIEEAVPDKSAPVVLYCAGGVRSMLAGKTLQDMGYTDVISLAGGYTAWKAAGLPTVQPLTLNDAQRRRYSRHLVIPEVGEEGQAKLLQSKVLLIGAGGLGSPAAYYLAAAGVGTLGIIDNDVVDESNLQRQILHNTSRVGKLKVESAKETIQALNPDITVNAINDRLTKENVLDIISGYDVILDGTDNFPTRYLLNDASVIARKPVVHGSVFRFEGQVTVFKPFDGPCYRCLFPEPPPPELAPNCAEAGVLGILPGTVGLLQATEVIKLLLGIGETLVGRLLAYDALTETFDELLLYRDPRCPACGENAHPEDLPTYEEICAVG
ncbi:MAG TPA: molybdopterin-synthase adenylyltransferase MoeB [Ktedonobacterales bacterium]|nr:molybdopterin-synthase adenylyltransferase MoeB [Ktedonobacterales bacterium]